MDDIEIIELYWRRSQEAIARTDIKYGGMCRGISYSILSSREDSEECVSDTYLTLWQRMPPERPGYLRAFIAAIVRNLSPKCLRSRSSLKRGGGEAALALEELEGCVASGSDVEKDYDFKELCAAIENFLRSLPQAERDIFICRYWLFLPGGETAKRLGLSKSRVNTSLFRTRQKLAEYLRKEGFI